MRSTEAAREAEAAGELVLFSHEARLYWLSATLSGLFFCRQRWDEQHMSDLKLNLLCGVGGHDHFGASGATILDTNFTNPHEANRESSSDWWQFVKLVSLFWR